MHLTFLSTTVMEGVTLRSHAWFAYCAASRAAATDEAFGSPGVALARHTANDSIALQGSGASNIDKEYAA